MLVTITEEKLRNLLEGVGSESRFLEFKENYKWENSDASVTFIQAKTLKTILALSNTENGGYIIIGIKELENSQFDFRGVSSSNETSFQDTEQIARIVDGISSGHIDFEVGVGEYNGKRYIIFSVKQFNRMPNFAARDLTINGQLVIAKNNIYVRANSAQPQTIKMSPDEFRDIVTLVESKDELFVKRFLPSSETSDEVGSEYEQLDGDL